MVLQLCLYSELVSVVQGFMPERSYVVAPGAGFLEPQAFRIADYSAYYRRVKASLIQAVSGEQNVETYPDPKPFCEICRWQMRCDAKRREDDHLCLVAGITKIQIEELKRHGVSTTADLGRMPIPLAWKPDRGIAYSMSASANRARIQIEGRAAGHVISETLPIEPGFGLTCLPEPSPGDIFFDLEGDPFVGEGGLEYLFGYAFRRMALDAMSPIGSFRDADEKQSLRAVRRFRHRAARDSSRICISIISRPMNRGALKRLMGRYATRADEIDRLLRSKLFIDLYSVVRHAVRASVESYSIKKLEALYGFSRAVSLSEATCALAKVQACLELGDLEFIGERRPGCRSRDTTGTIAFPRRLCGTGWNHAARHSLAGQRRSPGRCRRRAKQVRPSVPGRTGSTI